MSNKLKQTESKMTKEETYKKIIEIMEQRLDNYTNDNGHTVLALEEYEIPFIADDIADLCFADVIPRCKHCNTNDKVEITEAYCGKCGKWLDL